MSNMLAQRMVTMLIANNCTVESGSFCGDQLCSIKAAYMFVENTPGIDHVIMSVSPGNTLHFLWTKFIERYKVELVHDTWNPGDWTARWTSWDRWRSERCITMNDGSVHHFDHYRELYLRIHGAQRQTTICGSERGLGRRNIYEYWLAGQENAPDTFMGSGWFDGTLIDHPTPHPTRDVYISPHAKTQGNLTFTFDFWSDVVHRLVDNGISVTVGYNGWFCPDLVGHTHYKKFWGSHEEWMAEVCRHKLVACGNTGTGWLAAACGVPMITMEPHNSVMADHRYRECGLKNIVQVVDGTILDEHGSDMSRVADYVVRQITAHIKRCVVMTTGCYDILHAGHIRHLQRARALGTKLIVALNSDSSTRSLKGESRPINPEKQRKTVLEALRCVDEVRLFDGPDALSLIEEVHPDILACGYGYTPGTIIGKDMVEAHGGKVVITCTEDATNSDPPSTTKIIKRLHHSEVLAIIRAAAPYSVNPPEKLKLLADQLLKVIHLPGDMADLGSCRGGSALALRRLAPDKHLHLFDTWAGTPYDDPLCDHKKGEWAAKLDECKGVVGQDERTHYWCGVFPNDIPPQDAPWWDQQNYCLVYVDMDTEQATRDAISFFWPRLVPGGILLFDDYGWGPCAGVKKAVDYNYPSWEDVADVSVVQSLYACVVTKK